jgi:hypothetical protein
MAYGILVTLEPPENTWPEGWIRGPLRRNATIDLWKSRLTAWEHGIKTEANALGARTVLAFTPLHQPAVAQTNVWIDDVGDNLQEAMERATELVQKMGQNGHCIRGVQILNWNHWAN